MCNQNDILKLITNFYLKSGDFNGCPYPYIKENIKVNEKKLVDALHSLITNKLVGLITDKEEMNPHIIRTGFAPIQKQLENLEALEEHYSQCFYPMKKHLKTVIDPSAYLEEPYKLELALGSPQLDYRSFDLSILEMYRNDPRYNYYSNDIGGRIVITDEYYESNNILESDKIILNAFGFSMNKDFKRAVGVFLCDLAKLSKEHQNMWKSKELDNSYKMHPGFYKSQVYGVWPDGVSIFDAFLKELYLINQICSIIGWPNLFNNDFGEYGEHKPKLLAFLIRPTLKEFNDFISELDKCLSQNINKMFFKGHIDMESETKRKDGKIIVSQKGTITLLDEFIRKKYKFKDDSGWKETINTLKKIRELRQAPAHKLETDTFDENYFIIQRKLIIKVYNSLNFIRRLLQQHPKVKKSNKLEVPDWLSESIIYVY